MPDARGSMMSRRGAVGGARCPRYGLAYSEQLVADALTEAWDMPVDGVITDDGCPMRADR